MHEEGEPEDARLKAVRRAVTATKKALDNIQEIILLGQTDLLANSYREFAKAAQRLDNDISSLVLPDVVHIIDEPAGTGEPIPDRLRRALADLILACVPDVKDRFVAMQLLALDGDGVAPTLGEVGEGMGVTRERIRQRRNRAFLRILHAAPRRTASCKRVRAVQNEIAADVDWSDPRISTRYILRLISDQISVVRHLAAISCLAAGWHGKGRELLDATRNAARAEARSLALEQHWRLDAWVDASALAIFPAGAKVYRQPPPDMVGRKREPGDAREGTHLFLDSAKLGRAVACESVSEYRVMKWLEKTPEVVSYQEQPVIVPYQLHGLERRYFPDLAVLDHAGHGFIIEVKPIYGMYREKTLAKSLACLAFAAARGMAYLIVDQKGRSLSDYAHIPYDKELAEEIEEVFDRHGTVRFQEVRTAFQRRRGKIPLEEFVSMVVNRDWAVSEIPVVIGRLGDSLSFRQLIARHT